MTDSLQNPQQPAAELQQPPAAQPPKRPALVLLIFLIFPLLGLVIALGITVSGSPQGGAVVIDTAPVVTFTPVVRGVWEAPDFRLTSLDGEQVQLAEFRGRVVFLNFWATWCEPCVREMPAFMQFAAEQGADGAVVLAVNNTEPLEMVQRWIDENGIGGFPIVLDSGGDVFRAYNVQALPTTFVLDGAGMVQHTRFGELTVAEMNDYLAATTDE